MAEPRTRSEWIATAEADVGAYYENQLAGFFGYAADLTNFCGCLLDLVAEQAGERQPRVVGALILARVLTELQSCLHLLRRGYAATALSVTATMLELMQVGAYVGSADDRARDWLEWDNPIKAYPGRPLSVVINEVAAKFDIDPTMAEREHRVIYRAMCQMKHGNPLAMGESSVIVQRGDVTRIVAGPILTRPSLLCAYVSIQYAVRYGLMSGTAFIRDHLSDEERAPLMAELLALSGRFQQLVREAGARFPESVAPGQGE